MQQSPRGVSPNRHFRLRLAALFYFLCVIVFAAGLTMGPLAWWQLGITDWRIFAAGAGGMFLVAMITFLVSRPLRCVACSQPVLRHGKQPKHAYAGKWLGCSHRAKVAWDILSRSHHHCMYCHTRCRNAAPGGGISAPVARFQRGAGTGSAAPSPLTATVPAAQGSNPGDPSKISIFDPALLSAEAAHPPFPAHLFAEPGRVSVTPRHLPERPVVAEVLPPPPLPVPADFSPPRAMPLPGDPFSPAPRSASPPARARAATLPVSPFLTPLPPASTQIAGSPEASASTLFAPLPPVPPSMSPPASSSPAFPFGQAVFGNASAGAALPMAPLPAPPSPSGFSPHPVPPTTMTAPLPFASAAPVRMTPSPLGGSPASPPVAPMSAPEPSPFFPPVKPPASPTPGVSFSAPRPAAAPMAATPAAPALVPPAPWGEAHPAPPAPHGFSSLLSSAAPIQPASPNSLNQAAPASSPAPMTMPSGDHMRMVPAHPATTPMPAPPLNAPPAPAVLSSAPQVASAPQAAQPAPPMQPAAPLAVSAPTAGPAEPATVPLQAIVEILQNGRQTLEAAFTAMIEQLRASIPAAPAAEVPTPGQLAALPSLVAAPVAYAAPAVSVQSPAAPASAPAPASWPAPRALPVTDSISFAAPAEFSSAPAPAPVPVPASAKPLAAPAGQGLPGVQAYPPLHPMPVAGAPVPFPSIPPLAPVQEPASTFLKSPAASAPTYPAQPDQLDDIAPTSSPRRRPLPAANPALMAEFGPALLQAFNPPPTTPVPAAQPPPQPPANAAAASHFGYPAPLSALMPKPALAPLSPSSPPAASHPPSVPPSLFVPPGNTFAPTPGPAFAPPAPLVPDSYADNPPAVPAPFSFLQPVTPSPAAWPTDEPPASSPTDAPPMWTRTRSKPSLS